MATKTSNDYYKRTANAVHSLHKWSDSECQKLRILRENNITFYDIALELGRSEAACYMKYARLIGRKE